MSKRQQAETYSDTSSRMPAAPGERYRVLCGLDHRTRALSDYATIHECQKPSVNSKSQFTFVDSYADDESQPGRASHRYPALSSVASNVSQVYGAKQMAVADIRESQSAHAPHASRALSSVISEDIIDYANLEETDNQPCDVGTREAHAYNANLRRSDLLELINDLISYQKTRRFCIKSQSRIDRSAEAFAARFLGFSNITPKAESEAIWKKVSAFRKRVEKDPEKIDPDDILAPAIPILVESAKSRECWDRMRSNTEKLMREVARQLPVFEWVQSVKGFGELGLAIVVGEAGDLSNYATKERLWKRLGLAVIDGKRQQRRTDPDEAKAHGYNPKRRAEVWTIADSMFRHQWAADKDTDGKNPMKTGKPVAVPAHPTGPYGAAYMVRKARTTEYTTWTPMHRENDARRIMTKELIADLWREWRKVNAS